MALTLDIPVRTSITLPDNWQDCQTPQQLSYWLIARFDELAKTSNINELKEMVTELRAYVDTYDARIDELDNVDVSLGEDITALEQSISTLRATLTTLENFLSDIDNTLTNLVRDVEGNTSDITTVDRRVDLVHEGNITNAQKIEALEEGLFEIPNILESFVQEMTIMFKILEGYVNDNDEIISLDDHEYVLEQDTNASGLLTVDLGEFVSNDGVWESGNIRVFDFYVECGIIQRELQIKYMAIVDGFSTVYEYTPIKIPDETGIFIHFNGFVDMETMELNYTMVKCSKLIASPI